MSGDDGARLYYVKRIKKVCEELDYEAAQTIYYFISNYIEADKKRRQESNVNKV